MKNSIIFTFIALFSFAFTTNTIANNGGYCNKNFYYKTVKNNDVYPVGKDVYVKVDAQNYHDISSMTLYLNDYKIRTEMNAPYEWGKPNNNGDYYLKNMKAGKYKLKCVVKTKCGNIYKKYITFYIKHIQGGGHGYCAQNYRYIYGAHGSSCQAGRDLYVKVGADYASKVEYMELYLDNYKIRREMNAPYEWGKSNSNSDHLLRNMRRGTYELKCKIKTKCGDIVWKKSTIYVN